MVESSALEHLTRVLHARLVTQLARDLHESEPAIAARLGPGVDAAVRAGLDEWARVDCRAIVGRVVASMAHELRNPLSVIETSAFIMGENAAGNERLERHARRIADQVQLASGVIHDMLGAARGTPRATLPTSLPDVLRAVISDAQAPATVSIDLDVPLDVPLVLADERGLRQVFTNLVRNALDAVGPRGAVRLVVVPGGTVRVHVEDSGPGVPTASLAHLFEPLFTTKPNGNGLGLSLSRDIIRAHGGDLVLTRTGATGTCFEVTLRPAPGAR